MKIKDHLLASFAGASLATFCLVAVVLTIALITQTPLYDDSFPIRLLESAGLMLSISFLFMLSLSVLLDRGMEEEQHANTP